METNRQLDKATTVKLATKTVERAIELLKSTGLFKSIAKYQPSNKSLYINESPIVEIGRGNDMRKAIAPDIHGTLTFGENVWIEVKDKSQRAFYPDTGCDIHQFIGFWSINHYLHEPVLMMFIDPDIDDVKLPRTLKGDKRLNYLRRLEKFRIGGEPTFYGSWLSVLAEYNAKTKYPLCCQEWSRRIPMKIVYFEIAKMLPFGSQPGLAMTLEAAGKHRETASFTVFDKREDREISDVAFYAGR